MQFLQKLLAIPQNVFNTFKRIKSQTETVQNVVIEQINYCQEQKIEVRLINHISQKKRSMINQETQTEPETRTQQILINQFYQKKRSKFTITPSKSNKKASKLNLKQFIQEESLSEVSDQREASGSCDYLKNILIELEQSEESNKSGQKDLDIKEQLDIIGKFEDLVKEDIEYQNRKKKQKSAKSSYPELYIDDKQLQKSTRAQSSEEIPYIFDYNQF